jgi:hypothetical protein
LPVRGEVVMGMKQGLEARVAGSRDRVAEAGGMRADVRDSSACQPLLNLPGHARAMPAARSAHAAGGRRGPCTLAAPPERAGSDRTSAVCAYRLVMYGY